MEKINLRGVDISNVTMEEAVHAAEKLLEQGGFHAVFTPNAEIMQMCIEDPEIMALINLADLVVPDGVGVTLGAKIVGTPLKSKVPGIELGENMVKLTQSTNHSIYFLGSKPGIAEIAKEKLLEKYPQAKIVGCHDGYFQKEGSASDAVIEEINRSGADVLFVCLGVPVQEKWIIANRDKLHVGLALGLGGSLDGYAGTVKRAPKIFIKLGLEWFYRLLKEPKRFKRMLKLPKFLFGTISHRFSGKRS